MAFDAFLVFKEGGSAKVTQGESQDAKYGEGKEFAIELESFSFGGLNSIVAGSKSGGAGAGRAELTDFSFVKSFDTATTPLFQSMLLGGHYKEVILYLRKTGTGTDDPYAKISMMQVLVRNIVLSGSAGSDTPMEQVSLVPGAIKIEYRKQDKEGNLGAVSEALWSLVKNAPQYEV